MNEWIKATDELPEGKVLVLYWNPFFGLLVPEITVGYYDNPDDYTDGDGKGWLTWDGNHSVIVSHWMPLPKNPIDIPKEINQKGFSRPELGTLITT